MGFIVRRTYVHYNMEMNVSYYYTMFKNFKAQVVEISAPEHTTQPSGLQVLSRCEFSLYANHNIVCFYS